MECLKNKKYYTMRKELHIICPAFTALIFYLCSFLFLLYLPLPVHAEEEKVPVYKIGSGDRLEINTWKEPDLSRANVLVRIDGKITFPLLGDIQASGLTTMQLKYDIEAGLKGYVDHPVVTVTVIESASQKFYMLGEIANPGEYQLVKGLTIVQALAIAGGFTEFANKNDITLFRYEEGKKRTINLSYKEIVSGKDFSQNIFLKANDTIIVP